MSIYKFGRPMPRGVKAEDIGQVIEQLIVERGEARPEAVVDLARNPDNPLHPCFEWDDTKAAEAHRIDQARYVLRAVVIVRDSASDTTIRAFVSPEREGGYRTIEAVMSDPTSRDLLIEQARRDLEAFSRKYQALEELSGVRQAIAEFVEPKKVKRAKAKKTKAEVAVEIAA